MPGLTGRTETGMPPPLPPPLPGGQPLPETVTDPPRENVVGDTLMVTLTTVKAMLALFGGEALSVTVIVVAPKAVPLGISKVRFSWPKNVVAVLDGVTATVPSVTVMLEFAAKPEPLIVILLVGLAWLGLRSVIAAVTVTWLPVVVIARSVAIAV